MGLLTVGTDTYINLDTGINLDVVDYILYIYTLYIYIRIIIGQIMGLLMGSLTYIMGMHGVDGIFLKHPQVRY